jgi:hypothetical protein
MRNVYFERIGMVREHKFVRLIRFFPQQAYAGFHKVIARVRVFVDVRLEFAADSAASGTLMVKVPRLARAKTVYAVEDDLLDKSGAVKPRRRVRGDSRFGDVHP